MKRILIFLVTLILSNLLFTGQDPLAGIIGSGEEYMSLEKAISRAMEHSYGVAGARYDSAAAYQDWQAARAAKYPTLSIAARTVYLSDLVEIRLIPGMTRESGVKETWQADARLTWPLYTGGRLSSGINIKRALARARAFDLETEKLSLAYRTRIAFLGALQSNFILNAAEASQGRLMTIRKDVQNLYQSGLADSLDILEAELAYQKVAEDISRLTAARDNAVRALATILGDFHDSPNISRQIPEPDDKYNLYRAEESPWDSLDRAELAALAARRDAAERGVSAAKGSYFPEISAFGGYSIGKPNRDFFAAEEDDYFSVGLNLNWTFNLGNGTGREIAAARSRARAAAELENNLKESLTLGVYVAFRNLFQAYDTYKIAREEVTLAGNKYRLAREKQNAGQLSVNRLLEMVNELHAAEAMYNAGLVNFYLAETEYLYALGSPKIYGGY